MGACQSLQSAVVVSDDGKKPELLQGESNHGSLLFRMTTYFVTFADQYVM